MDATRSQKKRKTKEHVDKKLGERNVDNKFEIRPEEDGGGSTGQSWME